MSRARVAVIRCSNYDTPAVEEAVTRGLALLGGAEAFVRPGENIVLKPNLLVASAPDKAVTTHPAVFSAVAKALAAAGAELSWGDSPGVGSGAGAGKRAGIAEVAQKLGLPYREGFFKNHYVGRTFIMPGQAVRKRSVRQKLNAMSVEFAGKHVLLVDDSIVRGTTSREIIEMARAAGARRVTFASAAPPVLFPHVYGINMPTRTELVAHGRTYEEISQELGADQLIYQRVADMSRAILAGQDEVKELEMSCFTGEYLAGNIDAEYLAWVEDNQRS